jgi:nicotinamidase-related amidase
MPIVIEKVSPSRTAVIVVDMQHDFIAPGAALETPMGREILPNLSRLLRHARDTGMHVIYTAHVHRKDGTDMGLFGEIWAPIEQRAGLVDGEPGVDVIAELAPLPHEPIIKKNRYSAFFGTNLDLTLRTMNVETVIITGVTTENCCHATARDAMFLGYRVAFLSDATGTFDYPDCGMGAVPAAEVHRVSLAILGVSTAHVMSTDDLIARTRHGEA